MAITKRERSLLAITITAIVLGLNYFLLLPLLRNWRSAGEHLRTQQHQLALMVATIDHENQWQKQYDNLRQSLGARVESFQQSSDVGRKILEVAKSTGVQISSSRPMVEEDKGVYRVLPQQLAVEATTDSLVRFLFELQTAAGFMSVEQLQVAPRTENQGILRCDIQVRALAAKPVGGKS
ncbi:MAG TPA: GspMb/PilO family protein [Verrucomicrobiae bacterium]|nr:GspMb/PilO family protein [Verrucomicrobiae bacterium]